MRHYLQTKLLNLRRAQIIIEDASTSAVEQLVALRKFADHQLIIVASRYFDKRVELYARYLLNNCQNVSVVGSTVPSEIEPAFKTSEAQKLLTASEWLSHHQIGDYKGILEEQQAFQRKVVAKAVDHPRS